MAAEPARVLGIARQAVHDTVRALQRTGWLITIPDKQAGNQRVGLFTEEGERMMSRSRTQWLTQPSTGNPLMGRGGQGLPCYRVDMAAGDIQAARVGELSLRMGNVTWSSRPVASQITMNYTFFPKAAQQACPKLDPFIHKGGKCHDGAKRKGQNSFGILP